MRLSIRECTLLTTLILLLGFLPTPARALTGAGTNCNISFIEVPVVGHRLLVKCEAAGDGAGGAKIWYFALDMRRDP
jgi:hypothetical protein